MRSWFKSLTVVGPVVVIGAGLVVAGCTTGPAGGQASADAAPRLAGTELPDLNGIWQSHGAANWDIQGHESQPGTLWELGAIGAVPPGHGVVEGDEIPYQPWAIEQKQQNFENRRTADPEANCYLPGVPRATYLPYPFQILQGTDKIVISYQFANASRIIHMDVHEDPPLDSWMGWSNGSWEGDTLAVDVTGFNGQAWFDRAGNFHSDALHVVERYTPFGPNHLRYEATIEDPNVFTRPWTMSMFLYRRLESDLQLLEFNCVEYSEELLYGHLRKQPPG